MGRPTNRKNVTTGPMAGIVGFCRVVCRCAMTTDGFLDGMGQTQILKTESKPKRNCYTSPDYFCGRKTKSDGGSRGTYTTQRAKISSHLRRCLADLVTQSPRLDENHVRYFLNVWRWPTSVSARSARFLTCYTHPCWMKRDSRSQFVNT